MSESEMLAMLARIAEALEETNRLVERSLPAAAPVQEATPAAHAPAKGTA